MKRLARFADLLGAMLLVGMLLCPGMVAATVLDVDGDGQATAVTDGNLILRHLFGIAGASLIDGVLGVGATRDAGTISAYIAQLSELDIDGNGAVDGFSDGVIVKRYLLGYTGSGLVAGVVAPDCTRCNAADILAYLASLDEAAEADLKASLTEDARLPGGVHVIEQTVTVPVGTTLTIEQGAELRFAGNHRLVVDGTLRILGADADPVMITSDDEVPTPGAWYGIEIASGATAFIDHALIEYARDAGITFNAGARGAVTNSEIRFNTYRGIWFKPDTRATLIGNHIHDNGSTGISLNGALRADVDIFDNEITANQEGIYLYGDRDAANNPRTRINGNSLYANRSYNLYTYYYGDPTATIIDARGNWWGSSDLFTIVAGIYDQRDNTYTYAPVVDCGSWLDGPGGSPVPGSTSLLGTLDGATILSAGIIYQVLYPLTVPTGASLSLPRGVQLRFPFNDELHVDGTLSVQGALDDPVVFTSGRANPARNDWKGISIGTAATNVAIDHALIEYADDGALYFAPGAAGDLTNSEIRESAGTAVWLDTDTTGRFHGNFIHANRYNGFYIRAGATPEIIGNLITANEDDGIDLYGDDDPAHNPAPVITGNDIYTNSGYDLRTRAFGDPDNSIVDARGNWWGTDDPIAIRDHIYDRGDSTYYDSPWVDFGDYQSGEYDRVLAYRILNPRAEEQPANVAVHADGTLIESTVGGRILDRDPLGSLAPQELSYGSRILGSGRFAIGADAENSESAVPEEMAGEAFVVPHLRGHHVYHLLAPEDDAVAQITLKAGYGTVTRAVYLPAGTPVELDMGSDNGQAAVIDADWPILLLHATDDSRDLYPVPPADYELWGIKNQSAWVGALQNDTTIEAIAADGSSETIRLDSGEIAAIGVGAGNAQGQGSALFLSADKLIAAVQHDDGDGDESTAFWPERLHSGRHRLPVDAQYAVVVCASATDVRLIDPAGDLLETHSCAAASDQPGQVYLGDAAEGTHLAAGSTIEADAPVYVIFDAATSNDEHNLLGSLDDGKQAADQILRGTLRDDITLPAGVHQAIGDVTIPAGVTLRLQPGAELRFAGDYELYVHGTLSAQGTEESPVTFTSHPDTPPAATHRRGDWGGIYVQPGADVLIEHAVIEYADYGLFLENSAIAIVRHSRIAHHYNQCIVADANNTLTLHDTRVHHCRQTGVWLKDASVAQIRNSEVFEAGNNGIAFSDDTSGSVTGSDIHDNDANGIWVGVRASVTITGNRVRANGDDGIDLDGDGTAANNPSALITGNGLFDNGGYNLRAYDYGDNENVIVQARENWWGSTDWATIAAGIHDLNQYWYRTPLVDYGRWLDASGGAPVPGSDSLLGPITSDTTLSADTAYQVLHHVTVAAGATLTIPAGVYISFPMDQALYVDGALSIQGTDLKPVAFTSGRAEPAKGDWQGIRVRTGAGPIGIAHALIDYGDYGIDFADGVGATIQGLEVRHADEDCVSFGADATVGITGASLRYCDRVGAQFGADSNVAIDNTIVHDCGSFGIDFGSGSIGNVSNTEVHNTASAGVHYGDDTSGSLTASHIHDNLANGIWLRLRTNISITGNRIIGNLDDGIDLDGNNNAADNPRATINGNAIHDNASYDLRTRDFGDGASTILDARGNWWGSTDLFAINARIHDRNTYPYGTAMVDFGAWLDGPGGAQTPDSETLLGTLAADSTLMAETVYNVLYELTVPAGVTLGIAQGAELRFPFDHALTIDGTLDVAGTLGNRVKFTSGRATPARGNWGGIDIGATAADVRIAHALVEYTEDGAIYLAPGASADISHSEIRESAGTGIWFEADSTGSVSQCYIHANRYNGIYIRAGATPEITGNLITANEDDGIDLYGDDDPAHNPAPVITGNDIYANSGYELSTRDFGDPDNSIVDARGNWWGTDDPIAIRDHIYDRGDSTYYDSPWVDFGDYQSGEYDRVLAYRILNPRAEEQPANVAVYADGTLIESPVGEQILDQDPLGSLAPEELSYGSRITGSGRFAIGSEAENSESAVPEDLAGEAFVVPHLRGHHVYHLLAPEDDAVAQITLKAGYGTVTRAVYLPAGTPVELDMGSDNGQAAVIDADWPILLLHATDDRRDLYPVPPADYELWGIKNQSAWVGALQNGTTVEVVAADGGSETITLDSGEIAAIGVGAGGTQGRGSALLLRADKPIAAVQHDDGDGDESTAFWPERLHSSGHRLPVDAQYAAVVCTVATDVRLIDPAGDLLATHGCAAAGDQPGQVHLGDAADGAHLAAGSSIDADAPVYVIYESAAGNDEHNLLGSLDDGETAADQILRGTLREDIILPAGVHQAISDIVVPAGLTLTLAPGAELRFPAAYELQVHGTLRVQGTAEDPVTLSAHRYPPPAAPPTSRAWDGIRVHAGADVLIEHAIIEYAYYGIFLEDGAAATVRHSEIAHTYDDCIRADANGQLTLTHSLLDRCGDHGISTSDGTMVALDQCEIAVADRNGIYFGEYTSGSINACHIHDSGVDGIRMSQGTTVTITGNRIENNGSDGVDIYSNRNAADNPATVITGNTLLQNGAYAVSAYNYGNPAGIVIDASGNWWGTIDPDVIAALIYDRDDNSSYSPIVDYSGFLDENGDIVLYIFSVTPEPAEFKPVADGTMAFRFNLPKPATVTMDIIPVTGTDPIRTLSQTYGSAGFKELAWDGKDGSGGYVEEGGYGWVFQVTDGEQTQTIDRSGLGAEGSGSGSVPPTYNVYKNEFFKMTYTMGVPGVVGMRVTPSGEDAFWPIEDEPRGPTTLMVWDGRRPDGSLVEQSAQIYFRAPTYFKDGAVIVEGTAPSIAGTGESPDIEVKSNPYLVVHSYEQVASIEYVIDQDSLVTVKLLPPGVSDFDSDLAITLVNAQQQSATDADGDTAVHRVHWRGYADTDTNDILISEEGAYTFAIQAVGAATGQATLYRGVLQLYQ